jgi:adenosine deaminase
MIRIVLAFIAALALCSNALADNTNTLKTTTYLNQIQSSSAKLQQFLHQMPKGADLHNHISGATYAKNLLADTVAEGFCVDPKTQIIHKKTPCDGLTPQEILNDPVLKAQLIDAWSLRDFPFKTQSGHDHFFATFAKFHDAVPRNMAAILAENVNRAARNHTDFEEIMILPLTYNADKLSAQFTWSNNFKTMQQGLMKAGIQTYVTNFLARLKQIETKKNALLKCNSPQARPGCRTTVRYQYLALRVLPKKQVFAQLLAGFMAANQSNRVVAINMVGPEDAHYATQDYTLQMQMVRFFKKEFPRVKISLHAGEITAKLAPSPQDLRFHIRQAVNIAGADRIGHGVDITHEKNYRQLLSEMKRKGVLVEINLTSNADILGVKDAAHPLPLYLKAGVPVTLSTDDEGILRTNITKEYLRAEQSYHLSYPTLKQMARNSLTYSFLPGDSLWKNPANALPVQACRHTPLGGAYPSVNCQAFLQHSAKARQQWRLEKELEQFEQHVANRS